MTNDSKADGKVTYTAWLTTNDAMAGADAGISISSAEIDEDGYRSEQGFIAHSDRQDWPDDDTAEFAADDVLAELGYRRIEQWTESGGQWATTVEPLPVEQQGGQP
jgi:hypothetical protein